MVNRSATKLARQRGSRASVERIKAAGQQALPCGSSKNDLAT